MSGLRIATASSTTAVGRVAARLARAVARRLLARGVLRVAISPGQAGRDRLARDPSARAARVIVRNAAVRAVPAVRVAREEISGATIAAATDATVPSASGANRLRLCRISR